MTTPHRLFGQNRRGVIHHVDCLAKTTWCVVHHVGFG